jgi:2-polyprenyl-6-methoxyphenol hydroxylase-like FAD-dependent oxidoreductase
MSPLPAVAVGGGLAGAAFALELARNGYPAVILERARAPHHKVCGEFLSAEAQILLQVLGLDLASLHAVPMSHACLVSDPIRLFFDYPLLQPQSRASSLIKLFSRPRSAPALLSSATQPC